MVTWVVVCFERKGGKREKRARHGTSAFTVLWLVEGFWPGGWLGSRDNFSSLLIPKQG